VELTHSTEPASDLIAAAATFAAREIAPRVQEYDACECLPPDLLGQLSDLGFFGGVLPKDMGGLGLDYVTFASLIEEISKVCHVMGTLISMPSGLVGAAIECFGSPEQKERWLRPLAEGRIFGAAAVTEPGSGSDVAAMKTHYRVEGSEFVINGSKAWISNLAICSFVLTFATRDVSPCRARGSARRRRRGLPRRDDGGRARPSWGGRALSRRDAGVS
jgi:alkylation response protein AidB-like acyl-CoA dehydrogenase